MTKTTLRSLLLATALCFGAATVLPLAAGTALAQTTPAAPAAKTMPKHHAHHMAKKAGSATVSSAQTALNKAGAGLTVDGKMGPKTRAAVKAFQKSHNLKVNGHLDKATRAALGV